MAPMAQAAAAATCAAVSPSVSPTPLFRFGLLSDVQHADKDDGVSFHGTPRYYRYALQQLDRAVAAFQAADCSFCIHLGDLCDGHNSQMGECAATRLTHSEKALRSALAHFERFGKPTLHLLGNHCLYNHPREELNQRLGISDFQPDEVPHSYYSYQPVPGWRIIMLDGYDVSILGWPPGHPLREQAEQLLAEHNPNTDKNSSSGLEGVQRRFVKFGGGISAHQLTWLRGELAAAAAARQRVIVACHLVFYPGTAPNTCLLWNYEEVLQILQQHAGTVVGTLSGHSHSDHSALHKPSGIRHRVCKAVLETPPGRAQVEHSECYGIVEVFPDLVRINGVDTFASEEWPLPPLPAAPVRGRGVPADSRGSDARTAHDGIPAGLSAVKTAVEDPPPLLLGNCSSRDEYLPTDGPSTSALGNAYTTSSGEMPAASMSPQAVEDPPPLLLGNCSLGDDYLPTDGPSTSALGDAFTTSRG
ncbi:hypothetical protein D9Q98_004449 [Chlorella vulgaris]|uniref:Manganese-dependent ADP-ribose/CDP-alcohol diphosphatase n=1 Tax=Chlorella vulgaris TaxID=3077 RepID=A0A9D4TQ44_CHLVU|nr:hypothetical protein D9Q98_004449 [Chlorella vulgaris]